MNFITVPRDSYDNFEECYDDWERRARNDSSISMKTLFNLRQLPLTRNVYATGSDVPSGIERFRYYGRDILDIEFLQNLEDSFKCSGMC